MFRFPTSNRYFRNFQNLGFGKSHFLFFSLGKIGQKILYQFFGKKLGKYGTKVFPNFLEIGRIGEEDVKGRLI